MKRIISSNILGWARGIMCLLPVTLLSLSASAQKQWTLEDCINYAIENNITLRQAKLKQHGATENRKQSAAALFPTLSASTNQSVGYRPWQNAGTATVTNGTVSTSVNKTYYNGSYSVNAQWTVWNGWQNVNQLKKNRLAEEQAGLTADETANSIQEKIAQLYVKILYMTEAIEVHRQSLETSKKNEERGRQMVDVGKMSKADLAQLTAQRSSDEYNIVEAESNLADSKLQLKQLLEITSTDAFEIAVPNATDEQALAAIPSLAEVYETALGLRPEIRNSKLGIESSELQLKIARAGWLPTVSMTGGLGTSTNSMSQNTWGSQVKTNFDASAGVSVSIPIIDGRKARTAVNSARIAMEQAQLELQDKEKQLYSTLEGFWLDAQNNQQKFRTSLTTVESEQASYNLLSEQFQLGLKNIVELMTGKDKLLQAQQNKLQSKYITILAMQLLKFYQGYEMKI